MGDHLTEGVALSSNYIVQFLPEQASLQNALESMKQGPVNHHKTRTTKHPKKEQGPTTLLFNLGVGQTP